MPTLYRIRQFWRTVFLKIDRHAVEQVQSQLTPAQWALFTQLQPAEQVHAFMIYHRLLEQRENDPELLIAALLHDVGKLRYHLNPTERAMVVLVKAIHPKLAQRWGRLPPGGWEGLPGWRKAFILAEQHPDWGAEMAHQAGVSALVETLIRLHEHPHCAGVGDVENNLLHKLWVMDNNS